IYTLSLHDALPICYGRQDECGVVDGGSGGYGGISLEPLIPQGRFAGRLGFEDGALACGYRLRGGAASGDDPDGNGKRSDRQTRDPADFFGTGSVSHDYPIKSGGPQSGGIDGQGVGCGGSG